MKRLGPEERFDAKIAHEPNTGCWLWLACLDRHGYGQFKVHQKMTLAHRFSWERKNGPVPPGLTLDHICRVRSCVNPDHLRPMTMRDNLFAPGSLAPSAVNARKTHCTRGHPYDFSEKRGRRKCRKCYNDYHGRYNAKYLPNHREQRRLYAAKYYAAHREEKRLYAANRRAAEREEEELRIAPRSGLG